MNEMMIQNIAYTVGNMGETMSSLEIARLTGKRHADILRDIRDFLTEIDEGDQRRFASIYQDVYGRDQDSFTLPKRECLGLASKYDAKLRMAIIDRWAELEYKEKNKAVVATLKDPRKDAIALFEYETTAINNVLNKLGYSQGYQRKEALEIGFRIEGETGEKILPQALLNDPQALNPETISEHTGTHAALVPMGSRGASVSHIASFFGKPIDATIINDILIANKLQIRISKAKYQPTEQGKRLCNTSVLASGKHKGTEVIKEWLYNNNKSLRDIIEEGVKSYKLSIDTQYKLC